ncbi:MAG: RNA polymerase sigma-70 factor [Ginsengibacter sp.]
MNPDVNFTEDNQRKLLHQISLGDQLSFRQCYHHFYKNLLQFAFVLTRNKEVAEELVEDVFIKFWKNKKTAENIRNVKVYLYTATKNTCLNYLSSKAHKNITEPFDAINIEFASPLSPDQILIYRETFAKIKSAIETLPPRCKMIFKLIREDGLKYKEVADILNLSTNTVEAQMTIAIRRIAFIIKEEFEKTATSSPAKK